MQISFFQTKKSAPFQAANSYCFTYLPEREQIKMVKFKIK